VLLKKVIGNCIYVLGRHPMLVYEHLSTIAGSSLSPNGQRTQMRHLLIHDPSKLVALEPPNNSSPPSTHMDACGIQNIFKTGGV
jgi:hypothetical protein